MVKPEDEGMADDGAEKVKETGGGGLSKPKGKREGAEAHNGRFLPTNLAQVMGPESRIRRKLWCPSTESKVVAPELRISSCKAQASNCTPPIIALIPSD